MWLVVPMVAVIVVIAAALDRLEMFHVGSQDMWEEGCGRKRDQAESRETDIAKASLIQLLSRVT